MRNFAYFVGANAAYHPTCSSADVTITINLHSNAGVAVPHDSLLCVICTQVDVQGCAGVIVERMQLPTVHGFV